MSQYESILSICNAAVSEVGGRNQITSLNDGSNEARQCSIWYDRMRRQLLRTAHWGFAREQVALQQVGDLYPDNTSPFPFLYAYDYPADCVKLRYLLQPPVVSAGNSTGLTPSAVLVGPTWMMPSRANRFVVSGNNPTSGIPNANNRLILTNVYSAIGVYTSDVTDPTQFDDLFSDALLQAIAFRIVTPLSGNVGMRQEYRQAAMDAILQARTADGNEGVSSVDHTPDWIRTRMVGGSPFGYGDGPGAFGAYGGGAWGNWFGGYDDMSWGM